jgi:hypothetical protein
LPNVSIHYGHFLTHEITMPRVPVPGRRQEYVRVIKTEEKGSDVNLATHLLHDAHMGRFEVAVVVSNDSDLLEPIKIVREQLRKKVGILNPHKKPSRALLPHIDFIKQIRTGALQASQFPATMSDRHGTSPSRGRGEASERGGGRCGAGRTAIGDLVRGRSLEVAAGNRKNRMGIDP